MRTRSALAACLRVACASTPSADRGPVADLDATGAIRCAYLGDITMSPLPITSTIAALWRWDPRWPERVHPLASAIDTPLPVPPERTHLLLDSKAPWVEVRSEPRDKLYPRFPEESIAEWHERLGLG
jgi:hypothetical protein